MEQAVRNARLGVDMLAKSRAHAEMIARGAGGLMPPVHDDRHHPQLDHYLPHYHPVGRRTHVFYLDKRGYDYYTAPGKYPSLKTWAIVE